MSNELYKAFISTVGKKYDVTYDYLCKANISEDEYELPLMRDFILFSMDYAKLNKNKRIILEGIWPLLYGMDPKIFKDSAVCILGLSYLASSLRQVNRDNIGLWNRIKDFTRDITTQLSDAKKINYNINKWIEYFSNTSMNEAFVDNITPKEYFSKYDTEFFNCVDDYRSHDSNKLINDTVHLEYVDDATAFAEFLQIRHNYDIQRIDNTIYNRYKDQCKDLKHIDYKNDHAYIFLDKDNWVGLVAVDDKKNDGNVWITAIVVNPQYRGQKISYHLLDFAVNQFHANALTVTKSNKVAIHAYEKCGFKIVNQSAVNSGSDKRYIMKLVKYKDMTMNESFIESDYKLSDYRLITNPSMNEFNDIIKSFSISYQSEMIKYYKWRIEENKKPDRKLQFLIWLDGNKLVAYAVIQQFKDGVNYLTPIVVSPEYRQHHIGTQIMNYIIKKYNVNSLTVDKDNVKAINLYKKCGFDFTDKFKDKDPNHLFMSRESAITEAWVFNDNDFYYRVEDFNNGVINLALLVGFSGSGKTTLAKLAGRANNVKVISLDVLLQHIGINVDILRVDKISPLFKTFFEEDGKRFFQQSTNEIRGKISRYGWYIYYKDMYDTFIRWIDKYAARTPDTKYIIEGIWPLMFGDSPTRFTNWCVIIKGTSFLKSSIRAVNRNINGSNILTKVGSLLDMIWNSQASIMSAHKQIMNDTMNRWIKYFSRDNRSIFDEGWRADLPNSAFGIPEDRKFPLNDARHVRSAIHLFGHAAEDKKKALARRIRSAAKKYGVEIPETSQVYKHLHEEMLEDIDDMAMIRTNDGCKSILSKDITKWYVYNQPNMRFSPTKWSSSLNDAVNMYMTEFKPFGLLPTRSDETHKYAYAYIPPSDVNDSEVKPIKLLTIRLNNDSEHPWDVELVHTTKSSGVDYTESAVAAISNPVIGIAKPMHYYVAVNNLGYTNHALMTDPDDNQGIVVNPDGYLEMAYINSDDIISVYKFIGHEGYIDRLYTALSENQKVDSLYSILTGGKKLLTESQIDMDPSFKRLDYTQLENKIISNLASFKFHYEQALNGMPVSIVSLESMNMPSFVNKYNHIDEISICEDMDGYYFYDNITDLRTESVNSVRDLTEDMLISIL